MKIGIDISTILNHGIDIGAGRYIYNLIKNLLAVDKENQYALTARYTTDSYLEICKNFEFPDAGETGALVSKPGATGLEKKGRLEFKLFKTTEKKLKIWNTLRFPTLEMLGFRADIFHCPDFLIAPTNNRNIILTINDLAFIRYPHFNFEWFVKKYTKEVNKNARIAKKIIAISASTRKDIIKFLGTAGKKVEVTHLAAGEIFKKLPPEQIDRTVYEKYKIGPRYILSVGTIEPRKNYVTLIRAFNHIKKTNPGFNFQLVIVGRTGWKSEAAYEEYNNSPCRNDIIFVGRATDDELVHIYNGAGLFVYPSVFEGFGLPVVEAMQCGIPVAASRSSSIPELIDCKQALFNPADEKDIAEKILKIVMDGKTRQELVECSERNAKRFSWKKTAEKTLEIYRQCYSSGPLNKHL